MNPAQLAREIARIERDRGRTARWRKRAIAHVVAEAGATQVIVNGELVGWTLPAGGQVCIKRRYRDAHAANDDLVEFGRRPGTHAKPVRAYYCPHCSGYHLTSEARRTG